jgi:PST family polysaccharide transporter
MVNWFFQGMEKMQYMAFTALLARLIFVVLVFVFITEKADNILFIFFLGIGGIVAGLLSIILAIRMYNLRFIKPLWQDIRYEVTNGWPFTLTNLSQITCQYIGIIILRIFTNDTLVGYYSIAEKIYFAIKLMLDAFAQVLYPAVCRLVQQGRDKVITYFRQTYIPFLFIVIIACAMIFVFSPQIIHFFVGHRYEYSSFLLRMLCIAAVIVYLNMPAHLMLFAANHKKSFLRIFTLGTVLNVLANIVLAKYFDATGTVIAVLITETFITAGVWIEIYRHYYMRNGLKNSAWSTKPSKQTEELI